MTDVTDDRMKLISVKENVSSNVEERDKKGPKRRQPKQEERKMTNRHMRSERQ